MQPRRNTLPSTIPGTDRHSFRKCSFNKNAGPISRTCHDQYAQLLVEGGRESLNGIFTNTSRKGINRGEDLQRFSLLSLMLDFVAIVGINIQWRSFCYGAIRLAIAYTSEATRSSTATMMPQQSPLNYMYVPQCEGATSDVGKCDVLNRRYRLVNAKGDRLPASMQRRNGTNKRGLRNAARCQGSAMCSWSSGLSALDIVGGAFRIIFSTRAGVATAS